MSSGHRSALQKKRSTGLCSKNRSGFLFIRIRSKENERGWVPFPVEYLDEGKPFYYEGTFFLCKGSEEELCAQAQQLYRKIAREELSRRVAFYAQKMGVSPTAIRINGAKGRWGSCSGKNSLNFSWRLMMAPEHAVNYVVVHELCHILHHDHSREFWQEVERFFPDWKECRNILAQTSKKPYFMIQE